MSLSYDTQRVTTADNVAISFRVAGLATRVTAALIDWLLLGIVLLVIALLASALATAAAQGGGSGQVDASLWILLASALSLLVVVLYFTVAQTVSAGRTLGKAAMGLRVIRLDGGTPSLGDNFLRSLGYLVDLLGVGPILMFVHPQSRRIGDLLGGTLVVRERTPVTLAAATAAAPVYLRSYDPGPPIAGLASLGEGELSAIRTFLGRPGLHPAQRAALAALVAAPLLDRLALPASAPERSWPAELLLERLYLQLTTPSGRQRG
jgi:uncharacterized RDD family membrane protein YckC